MIATLANNIDQYDQGTTQKLDTLSAAATQAKKIELLAKRAEDHAKQAEAQAETADSRAGKVELEVKAYIHRATVEADRAVECDKKSKTESAARAKLCEAEATAACKTKHAIAKMNEVEAKAKPYKDTAAAKRAAKNKVEARESEKMALEIEAEAKESKAEARKAVLETKKIKLEIEEAIAANTLRTKHTETAAEAESQAKIKQAEVDDRRAEAAARRAQAAAKMAEAKAIRAGDTATAEKKGLEARMQKAKAIALHAEITEKQAEIKLARKRIPQGLPPPRDQLPKRQARFSEKKHLSAPALLNTVREVFQEIPDKNRGLQGGEPEITLCDCLMSGLALFGLKYPSLLQFTEDSQEGGCIQHNLQKLYKVKKVPSDTYMRERLDEVDPLLIRSAFKKIFAKLQRGKELEEYVFFEDYYLASGDASGYFSSKKIHCKNCCIKRHNDGSLSYYHQMMSMAIVHPDRATVFPLCPEAIINMHDSTKNDCERTASERLYRHIRREHPHLRLIITEDALGSNGPHIRLLNELDMRYIIVAKPDGNKSLFEFLNGVERQEYRHADALYTYKIQFVNNVTLNDSHTDLEVNFLEAWVEDNKGNVYHNSWVTDIPITMKNAFRLFQGGRAKWKIENETFNTLKNQGYHFEHNFGHGYKNLSTVFSLLMFLAFLIDQIQQSCCGLFQAALANMKSKVRLWARMRAYFTTMFIDSWELFWQGIAFGVQEARLIPLMRPQNTS